MIYCITLIVVVTIICATRLYPLWLHHNYKRTHKAIELVRNVRKENNRLRKELDETYKEWFSELSRYQKSQNDAWDAILKMAELLNIKL